MGVGAAAVTFLCATSWETSIFFKNIFGFFGKGYKISFAINSSVSSFCFSQNSYCLYCCLGSDMRFCAQTTLYLLTI